MLLKDIFYKVINTASDNGTVRYTLSIIPDCKVYEGHFPGDPVCPGVCNIQTIRECTEMHTGRSLHIAAIKQCRLTAIATPTVCPEVTLALNIKENADGTLTVMANISDAKQSYMDFKGTMK